MAKKATDIDDAHKVCDFIAEGDSVRVASVKAGLEQTKFFRMMAQDPDGPLVQHYTRARTSRADARFERMDDIVEKTVSGELDPSAARVAMDAIKWQTGKENAKRYGDKLDLTTDNKAFPSPIIQMLKPDE